MQCCWLITLHCVLLALLVPWHECTTQWVSLLSQARTLHCSAHSSKSKERSHYLTRKNPFFSPTMRLYNQNSKNPMSSVGLDAKQLRPVKFLRETSHGTPLPLQPKKPLASPSEQEAKDDNASFHSATTASESRIGKCEVVKKTVAPGEFLFDINDGDVWSTGSASTLSTQASSRNNAGTFPSWTASNPTILNSKSDTFPGKSRTQEIGKSDLIPIPELAFSGSSSEDTTWFDFTDQQTPTKHSNISPSAKSQGSTKMGLCLYPVQKRIVKEEEQKSPGMYSKYTTMLIEGIKAHRVKEEMEKDEVDPSIIELMMAASETNELF